MKKKLQNLPFVVKVILSFLITILSFILIFLFLVTLSSFKLLEVIFSIICVILIITVFSAAIYHNIFKD